MKGKNYVYDLYSYYLSIFSCWTIDQVMVSKIVHHGKYTLIMEWKWAYNSEARFILFCAKKTYIHVAYTISLF